MGPTLEELSPSEEGDKKENDRISSTESSLIRHNPIALRKAKIVYNFGFSECNRVK